MENIFLHLLNLSITAGYIILAVILLRFLLFKAPKWINCILWAVVGLRLALPFSIESIFSLIPSAEPIPADIMLSPTPQIYTGIGALNSVVNPIIQHSFTPNPGVSANPLQLWVLTAAIIWIIGLCAILLYGIVSYIRLKIRVSASINLHDNVYCCDSISSPFILGIFRPRIYIPSSIGEEEAGHVIAHENAHLARKDHFFKPLGFLILAVYWFSPLVWVAYILFCRDVEKACDERVICDMDTDGRKEYSEALLNCSIRRFSVSACPLAFGEVGVKSRIKAILNYKKPAFWIIIVAIVACIALAICFLTMPQDGISSPSEPELGITDSDKLTYEQQYLMEQHPEFFGLDASGGLNIYVYQLAPEHYSFYLSEHSENTPPINMASFKGSIGASSMRLILDTYDVTREDITVIPFQHPLSSYIGSIFYIQEGEASEVTEARKNAYKEKILDMLFEDVYLSMPIYDSMQFDVDGDGKVEHCVLGFGVTSGLFTFTFKASEVTTGEWEQEYFNVFISDWYKLSFVTCDDGIVRVQGIDRNDDIHLFDISIVGVNVHLTENGVPIGEITVPQPIE